LPYVTPYTHDIHGTVRVLSVRTLTKFVDARAKCIVP